MGHTKPFPWSYAEMLVPLTILDTTLVNESLFEDGQFLIDVLNTLGGLDELLYRILRSLDHVAEPPHPFRKHTLRVVGVFGQLLQQLSKLLLRLCFLMIQLPARVLKLRDGITERLEMDRVGVRG